MKKRKVLFVTNHLTVGGVQKSLISALNAIDYSKNDVTLYVRKNRIDLLPYVNANVRIIINNDERHYYRNLISIIYQLKIIFFRFFRNKIQQAKAEKMLDEYIKSCQMMHEKNCFFSNECYDIAIAYVQGYTTEFVAKIVSAREKIMFYQGSTDELHDLHKMLFPQIKYVVVEHLDIKNLLLEWYSGLIREEQVVIIPNYTDKNILLRQGKESCIEFPKDRIILCTCARMAHVKGFDLAAAAAKILRDSGYKFVWYFVGDGPEHIRIEKIIEDYELKDCIVLAGMQKNPYPYMFNCDIYVQPSREEALSIAMLESQLLARPMVSTKTIGGMSMIEDGRTGILTEIGAEALADGIERLVANPELREKMSETLGKIDCSVEKQRYSKDWENLLEG